MLGHRYFLIGMLATFLIHYLNPRNRTVNFEGGLSRAVIRRLSASANAKQVSRASVQSREFRSHRRLEKLSFEVVCPGP